MTDEMAQPTPVAPCVACTTAGTICVRTGTTGPCHHCQSTDTECTRAPNFLIKASSVWNALPIEARTAAELAKWTAASQPPRRRFQRLTAAEQRNQRLAQEDVAAALCRCCLRAA